jgi:hypothetical protein
LFNRFSSHSGAYAGFSWDCQPKLEASLSRPGDYPLFHNEFSLAGETGGQKNTPVIIPEFNEYKVKIGRRLLATGFWALF